MVSFSAPHSIQHPPRREGSKTEKKPRAPWRSASPPSSSTIHHLKHERQEERSTEPPSASTNSRSKQKEKEERALKEGRKDPPEAEEEKESRGVFHEGEEERTGARGFRRAGRQQATQTLLHIVSRSAVFSGRRPPLPFGCSLLGKEEEE